MGIPSRASEALLVPTALEKLGYSTFKSRIKGISKDIPDFRLLHNTDS